MAFGPPAGVGMLMGGVVVDDGVDRLARGDLLIDDIEEANEIPDGGRWRCRVRPITVPSRMFIAANSVVVPWRS